MWRFTAAAAFALLSALTGSAAWAGPSAGASSGLELTVRGTGTNAVVRLTNRGTRPCQVATTALGTVGFTEVDQGGAAVTPRPDYPTFDDDLGVALRHHLRTLPPGGSIDLAIRTDVSDSRDLFLEAVTWSPALALGFLYPVRSGSPVRLAATYALPVDVDGVPACPPAVGAGATAPGGRTAAAGWAWVLVAAAVVVMVAVIVVLVVRSRSRRARVAGSAVVILLLALAAAVGGSPARAYATITADSDTAADWDTCLKLYHQPGNDPAGIVEQLRLSSIIHVKIDLSNVQNATSHSGTTTFIHWYVHNPEDYEPGVPRTPCDTLYHELYHAWQDAYGGGEDRHECITPGGGRSGISIKEVNSIRAQNKLRVQLGLAPRTRYGDVPLPDGPCLPSSWGNPYICTGEPEVCARSNGDPHLWTYDGTRYDFQAVGEFVATRDPAGGFEIQVRQQRWADSRIVAVNTAVAADVHGDRVEIDMIDGRVRLLVGGVAHPPASAGLPGGGSIAHDVDDGHDAFTLTWPDGSRAEVVPFGTWGLQLIVDPAAARAGRLEGLLGDFDGNPADDVRPRGGAPIAKPTFDTLYPAYADSWRIDDAASLFTYAPGTSTRTYTDPAFPARPAVAKDLPGYDWATTVCRDNDVTDPATVDACAVDLILTGRPDFVVAAEDTQAAMAGLQVGGAAWTVDVGAPGGIARVNFAGTENQRILIEVAAPTLPDGCGVVTLRAPDGTAIGGTCVISGKGSIDTTVLPATGTYTIVVDPPGDATGQVTLRVLTATDSQAGLAIGGPAATARVDRAGGVARLTFTAVAGQAIFVDYTSTLPEGCGLVRLLDLKDAVLGGGCVVGGKGFIDRTALPATGTYTILVDPAGTDTGEVTLRLIGITDQAADIVIGGPPVTATIGQPGGVARLTFSGTAGQKVGVEVSGSTLPDGCGVLSLRKPDGSEVSAGCVVGGKGFVDGTPLPDSGRYTLLIDPGGRDIGRSTVRLFAITDFQGAITVGGAGVTVTIGQPGGVGRLTFDGTAGQKVGVEVSDSTLPDQCGVLSLRDPANSEVAAGCIVGGQGGIATATLPVTGRYTILLDPGWPDTGTATVRVRT